MNDVSAGQERRRGVLRVLGEVMLIVVGVLLALGVDSWRERMAGQSALDGLLLQLTDELKSNHAACEAALPLHLQAEADYRAAFELLRTKSIFERPARADEGAGEARLSDAAFLALLGSSVVEQLAPDRLIQISDVYSEQRRYLDRNRVYFAALVDTDLTDGLRFFRLNQYWAADMADGERRLLKRYRTLIDQLASGST